jgi:hypothetical protein
MARVRQWLRPHDDDITPKQWALCRFIERYGEPEIYAAAEALLWLCQGRQPSTVEVGAFVRSLDQTELEGLGRIVRTSRAEGAGHDHR